MFCLLAAVLLLVVTNNSGYAVQPPPTVKDIPDKNKVCQGKYFKLTPNGGNSFTLTYYEGGQAKNTFSIVSGFKGKVPTEASKDTTGSDNPIPQGVFSIDDPQSQMDINPAIIGDIGPTWINVNTKGYGGRSAIGIHVDNNRDGQSHGCVTLSNPNTLAQDIETIKKLVLGGARTIVVDHGLTEHTDEVANACSVIDGTGAQSGQTEEEPKESDTKTIAEVRNTLAQECFGGAIISYGFAVPFIFGEKLHEYFAPYVSGVLVMVFAIWAYFHIAGALLPFAPKDRIGAMFNLISVRFFMIMGVSLFLLAPQTGYTAYRDYIVGPVLNAATKTVDAFYKIGIDTNPTFAKFAKEDGTCEPTKINGLDPKLKELKDNIECKVCMIQRAYSYPWSFGLVQMTEGRFFSGLALMIAGIAPFFMFLFSIADVFMVRIGYISCTLSAYMAAACFPASRNYAITAFKSIADGALVLITSMVAAMLSMSMLTVVIENLDKGGGNDAAKSASSTTSSGTSGGGAGDNSNGSGGNESNGNNGTGTPKAKPSMPPEKSLPNPGGVPEQNPTQQPKIQSSNFDSNATTFASGTFDPSASYASWYRDNYLRADSANGFDTFREKALSGDGALGNVPLVNPFANNRALTSGSPGQEFLAHRGYAGGHTGQDYNCDNAPLKLRPMTPCRVIIHRNGRFVCRVMNGSTDTNFTFGYVHAGIFNSIPDNTIIDPSVVIGYCSGLSPATGKMSYDIHLHVDVEVCDNLTPLESLTKMQETYPGPRSFRPGRIQGTGGTGRNCYFVNPNIFLKGAMAFNGTQAAGFSVTATNAKKFTFLGMGIWLVLIICIITVNINTKSIKWFMLNGADLLKSAFQMVLQTVSGTAVLAFKGGQAMAPAAGFVGGITGNVVFAIGEKTGLNNLINRAVEATSGAVNQATSAVSDAIGKATEPLTNALSGVMNQIGGAFGSITQTVNTAVEQKVADLKQALNTMWAGAIPNAQAREIVGKTFAGIGETASLARNAIVPTAGFLGARIVLPAALDIGKNTVFGAASMATGGMVDLRVISNEFQGIREAMQGRQANLGDANYMQKYEPAVRDVIEKDARQIQMMEKTLSGLSSEQDGATVDAITNEITRIRDVYENSPEQFKEGLDVMITVRDDAIKLYAIEQQLKGTKDRTEISTLRESAQEIRAKYTKYDSIEGPLNAEINRVRDEASGKVAPPTTITNTQPPPRGDYSGVPSCYSDDDDGGDDTINVAKPDEDAQEVAERSSPTSSPRTSNNKPDNTDNMKEQQQRAEDAKLKNQKEEKEEKEKIEAKRKEEEKYQEEEVRKKAKKQKEEEKIAQLKKDAKLKKEKEEKEAKLKIEDKLKVQIEKQKKEQTNNAVKFERENAKNNPKGRDDK